MSHMLILAERNEQYIPMADLGRTLSITIPTVLAKRTGLCGVLPEAHNPGHISMWEP